MMHASAEHQAKTLAELSRKRAMQPLPTAKILTVCSGKGGVGKTVVAVNLALRFAATGLRTLLIDLDPGLANVDVHMRLTSRYDVDDILEEACQPEEALLVADRGLHVLPGGRASEAERARLLSIREASGPRRLLEAMSRFLRTIDVVVLDTGAGLGPWVQGAIAVADRTLVVTQSDPAAVTDAYGAIKVAHALRPDREAALLVNRVANKDEAILTATRLRKVASQFLGFRPEFFGWMHDHAAVVTSVRDQLPFALRLDDQHPTQRELAAISARLADALELRTKKRSAP